MLNGSNSSSSLLYWKSKSLAACNVGNRAYNNNQITNNKSCCNNKECIQKTCIPVTERSLLQTQQNKYLQCVNQNSILQNLENQTNPEIQNQITQNIVGLLNVYSKNRLLPYQRIPPPFIPPSVMQMNAQNVNAGVPHAISSVCESRNVTTIH